MTYVTYFGMLLALLGATFFIGLTILAVGLVAALAWEKIRAGVLDDFDPEIWGG